MSEQFAIETRDLTKKYDQVAVVDKLNFQVRENEIFGLLGPNGAGKTTTILMLLGLTEPSSGTVRVFNLDPARDSLKVKRIVGYLPEEVGFYDNLTARENLRFIAELNRISPAETERRIDEALEKVGLSGERDLVSGKFSRGMRQRLGIADVLIKQPKMVILDEPTSGLDPKGINDLLELIANLPAMGTTVMLSSHQLYQVQKVCHRVGILSKGKMVVEGGIEELGRQALAGGRYLIDVEIAEPKAGLEEIIKGIAGVEKIEADGRMFKISTGSDLRSQIARLVIDSGASLVQMKVQEFTLDDIYMKYFQEKQEE
ncbi:MAG: ABC transporter ATP-binding protein [Chloroflexi bacterium RBG_16_58_8]|nr:MAG: ABC transporter ATP-binding protein [Chloroflexi bacterium RBG_16_58_8]